MTAAILTTVLRVDAVANVVGGAALAVAADWLAEPMGLGSVWPLVVAAAVLVVTGVENWWVSHRTTGDGLRVLAAVDLAFGVGVVLLAVLDPTGIATWLRWTLVAVGDAALLVGTFKLVGLRSAADVAVPGR